MESSLEPLTRILESLARMLGGASLLGAFVMFMIIFRKSQKAELDPTIGALALPLAMLTVGLLIRTM